MMETRECPRKSVFSSNGYQVLVCAVGYLSNMETSEDQHKLVFSYSTARRVLVCWQGYMPDMETIYVETSVGRCK